MHLAVFEWFSASLLRSSNAHTNYPVTDRNSVRQNNNIDLFRSREENVQFWFFYRGPATALSFFFYEVENLGLLVIEFRREKENFEFQHADNIRHYSLSLCLCLMVLFVEPHHVCLHFCNYYKYKGIQRTEV